MGDTQSMTASAHSMGRFQSGVASGKLLPLGLCAVLLSAPLVFSQEIDNLPADAVSPDSDVDRLRTLLLRHHGADESAVSEPAAPPVDRVLEQTLSDSEMAAALGAPYSAGKILLRIDEWPLLLAEIDGRLQDASIPERRSDTPLIGTTQTRQRGSLVGRTTYSLKHIGKDQFVAETDFGEGRNIVSVSDFQWEIELPALAENRRYILFLTAPPRQNWVLHALPAGLTDELGPDAPLWLKEPSAEASAAP